MDVDLTESIHENLNDKNLLPSEHFADTGYVSAEHLFNINEKYDVEIVGPVLPDTSWQALQQNGFDLTHFKIDWEQRQVLCPQGCMSQEWSECTQSQSAHSTLSRHWWQGTPKAQTRISRFRELAPVA